MASVLSGSKLTAIVAAENAARAKNFYGKALGLRLVSEDSFALVFDDNRTMVRVTPVRKRVEAQYTIFGWQAGNIASAVAELASSGVTLERFSGMDQDANGIWSAPGGAKVAWFKDPDGNVLSVSQHTAE